ncbi:phage tail protein [Salmonella enterica subsp. enterica serovar Hadar]|uniref:Phage tail protein n=2 Tax=Salmonella enterica I TaxID=59201 RepID=A0A5J2S398_SALMS|nr:phage tail protein [Salmonella enterica subsp. enterica serovar Hadar]EAB2334371.1 phage tail protein [Salmonella enterica]EBE4652961.1 tail fiber assembly protein [Salmonella enterica subsp. enterica serovar Agona]EBJ5983097.1 phage tail protein [Salmonella enterica subsp. enterica serovar Muenster]EBV1689721.1 phage tail protein [Salmonella enterica subsp. enterica serovar Newport]ECA1963649.1 phage tail protein [Salmonella enterica subsp. enterica serovar Colindale]ECC3927542.1 phage ta
MQYFKNKSNAVFAYEDDCDEEYILEGLIKISEPEAMELLAPTAEELTASAEANKSRLLLEADSEIDWRQDAVDLGIATEDEKAQLDEWKKYRVLVNRVDTSKPDWPDRPASQ